MNYYLKIYVKIHSLEIHVCPIYQNQKSRSNLTFTWKAVYIVCYLLDLSESRLPITFRFLILVLIIRTSKIIWFFRESEEVEQMSSPLIILCENMIRMKGKVEMESTSVLGNTTKERTRNALPALKAGRHRFIGC